MKCLSINSFIPLWLNQQKITTSRIGAAPQCKRRSLDVCLTLFMLQGILTGVFLSLYLCVRPAGAIMAFGPHGLLCPGTATPTQSCTTWYSEAGKRAATTSVCLPPLSCLHLTPQGTLFQVQMDKWYWSDQIYSVFLQGEIFKCTALLSIKLFFQPSRRWFGGRQKNGNLAECILLLIFI